MDSMESSTVPPGFRFHPTDEELVGYYLRKKVASQKIDLDVIRDIDLYRIEPWDLQERCRIGYEEQNEWYFFSHKDKKYPTGTRTNRATIAGFWKATGRDKAVYDKTRLIGMRKTLVFYKGRAPNGQKSDWIMHEYRLESDDNGPPQEEGWVVCRAFKKRTTGSNQNKAIEGWESNYFHDEPSGSVSSIVDPISDYVSRHPHHQSQTLILPQNNNFMCKQELEVDNLSPNFNNNIMIHQTTHSSNNNNDIFVQLPPLESPSLPLMKRPISSVSLVSETNEDDNFNKKLVTTDWRALDKFVASQLSQDLDGFNVIEGDGESSFGGANHDQDFETTSFMLLQSSCGTESTIDHHGGNNSTNKLMSSVFLNSSDQEVCDFGICIFEN